MRDTDGRIPALDVAVYEFMNARGPHEARRAHREKLPTKPGLARVIIRLGQTEGRRSPSRDDGKSPR
jgi:hypothetical protein